MHRARSSWTDPKHMAQWWGPKGFTNPIRHARGQREPGAAYTSGFARCRHYGEDSGRRGCRGPRASMTCADTSNCCSNPQGAKERRRHEHEQYLSRYFPWQQNQSATSGLGRPSRRRSPREGIAAWKAWVEKHHAAIVSMGGPLGKTKKVTQHGIDAASNDMGAFTVVHADSHEAAAKLFEKHPHFTIFPGDSVEVMPVLPIPGA